MAVQLSVMQGMAQVQRESSGLQTVHDEKQSERLVLALAGGALNISNGGSIPSTVMYVRFEPQGQLQYVNATMQSEGSLTLPAPSGATSAYAITSLGNSFYTTQAGYGTTSSYSPGARFFFSPNGANAYYIIDPVSTGWEISSFYPDGTPRWTSSYASKAPFYATASTMGLVPSPDPGYTLTYTEWHYNRWHLDVGSLAEQFPTAQSMVLTNLYGYSITAGTPGFLVSDLQYRYYSSTSFTFWFVFHPFSPQVTPGPAFDPGPYPTGPNEIMYGYYGQAYNGSDVIQMGAGTASSLMMNEFPSQGSFPGSAFYMRVYSWNGSVSLLRQYNLTRDYPGYPYVLVPTPPWTPTMAVDGVYAAVVVPMRTQTTVTVFLDVYDTSTGALLARRVLYRGGYSLSMLYNFRFAFLDAQRLLVTIPPSGVAQVLDVAANLSVASTAPLASFFPYSKTYPSFPSSYVTTSTIPDIYILPNSTLAVATSGGILFFNYSLASTGRAAPSYSIPQPGSADPILVQGTGCYAMLLLGGGGASGLWGQGC